MPTPAGPGSDAADVVLVVHDSGVTTKALVEQLLSWSALGALVVVDDGSIDETANEAEGIVDDRLTVLRQPGRLGRGAAWRRGMHLVGAGPVVLLDGSSVPAASVLDELLYLVNDGSADIARSVAVGSAGLVEPFSASVARRSARFVSNRLTGTPMVDLVPLATVLAPSALAVLDLEEDGIGVHAELVAKAAQRSLRVVEVAIEVDAVEVERPVVSARDAGALTVAALRWSSQRDRLARPRHRRPARGAPVTFDEADAELAEALDSLNEEGHSYADWVASICEPYLGHDVLEVGAGHGSLTARFAHDGRRVVATDLSVRCIDALNERFAGRPDIEVYFGDVMDQPVEPVFDSVVLVNVLEHIPDDLGALRRLAGTLRPGGHVVVFVPAFEGLYSDFDRRVGHVRRYRRAELLTTFAEAGLEPVEGRYVNTLGALAWWLVVRQMGIIPTTRGLLRVYDRAAVPMLRFLERGRRPPFGQSLLVAGRVAG